LQRTVVGSILLAADQELGVEQLAVGSGTDLIDRLYQSALNHCRDARSATYRWVQVDEDGAGDVFAAARLGEEGLEGATLREVCCIRVGATVSQKAVLEQVPGQFESMRVRGIRMGSGRRTAPRRCYQAACRPGRCEGGRSVGLAVSIPSIMYSSCIENTLSCDV
jgi:hypothetical protein